MIINSNGDLMPEKVLVVDAKKCTGCRKCELVCSVFHTGTSDPGRSRIRVLKMDEIGFYLPMSCQNCDNPFCTEVCPAKACHRDLITNKIIIDKYTCIGCKTCILACPFGIPLFDKIESVSIKCDFCDGDPQCVTFCESGAIDYVDVDFVGVSRRNEVFSNLVQSMTKI